ncbi:MAG: tetratricopeptide repeat protein [Nitrospinae bacterium]|nr:tetratricopeptide repeat protein [Nitrospinota bacterium]
MSLASYFLPLVSSLIFVTHPVLTEAVNAISFREDLLCFLFYISALILYIYSRQDARCKMQDARQNMIQETRDKRYLASYFLPLASCLFYLLALLSKEMAVTLPLIVYGYERLLKEKGKRFYSVLLSPLLIGYAVVTLIYLYIRFLFSHIKLAIWPVNLSADYSIEPIKTIFSISFILPSLICILFLITALKLKKPVPECSSWGMEKYISLGIFFFFITLIPVYNIIPIAIPLAERYQYLPIAGFAIALGMVIHKAAHSDASPYLRGGWVGLSLLIIITALYSTGTIKRNYIWKDGYSLWTDTIKKSPNGYLPNNNIGVEYFKNNLFDKAEKHFNQAIKLKPEFVEAYYNLGLVLAIQGRIEEAIVRFNEAIKLKPDYSEAHQNLGVALESQGKLEKAFEHYNEAVKFKPNNVEALNNLALLIIRQEKFGAAGADRAVQLAEQACRLTGNRNAVCLNTLAAAYAAGGQFPKAVNAAIEGIAQAIVSGQTQLANEIRNNLELYKKGQLLPR